ncbi:hypothetical protein [Nocardia arthritidis]|nr:hypothetical protein [Nocardia arthritidis]
MVCQRSAQWMMPRLDRCPPDVRTVLTVPDVRTVLVVSDVRAAQHRTSA